MQPSGLVMFVWTLFICSLSIEICRSAEAAANFTDRTDDRASTTILNFDCVCKKKKKQPLVGHNSGGGV